MQNTVTLRPVLDSDLPIFFEQQNDPVANEMASFPARDRETFFAHWDKVRANSANRYMTVVYEGQVAGNMLSFNMEGHREVGYWIGREFWGKGIASEALSLYLREELTRPLYGVTVRHNHGSRRVLEKCGFVFLKEEGDEVFLVLE